MCLRLKGPLQAPVMCLGVLQHELDGRGEEMLSNQSNPTDCIGLCLLASEHSSGSGVIVRVLFCRGMPPGVSVVNQSFQVSLDYAQ